MGHISELIIDETMKELKKHLITYQHDIERAYCRADNNLDITLKVSYSPIGSGTQISTSINFIESRIKDSSKITINEKQLNLFSDRKIIKLPTSEKQCGYTEGQWRMIKSRRGVK